jgi:nucleoside-diphosphate-sugar epimerase
MDAPTQARLAKSLDLIVNSAGLTDFNPDLRDAMASNVDSTLYLLDFLRKCDHAGLMHLSTCYVVGMRDGRVDEELLDNYNPANDPDSTPTARSIPCAMIQRVEERPKARS